MRRTPEHLKAFAVGRHTLKDTCGRRRKRLDNAEKTDYRKFRYSIRNFLLTLGEGLAFAGAVNGLFYQSMTAFFFLWPVPVLWLAIRRRMRMRKRLKKLNLDFREALNCLAVSMRAGYSVENAFRETARSLKEVLGAEADMTREFVFMNAQIKINVPVEKLLQDFADRTGLEDIMNFAAVFAAAKRMGGPMNEIIRSTAKIIGDRIDVEREIETVISGKVFEQRILALALPGIILYMNLASPGFLDVLYGTAFGTIVMTICLGVYAGAFFLGARIVRIEV